MKVKYYLAEGNESDRSMMDLLSLARNNGQTGIGGLANFKGNISLSQNRGALVIVGGRDSIVLSLTRQGPAPQIIGGSPFLFTFARKHKVFGKNETCLKIVRGRANHPQPQDGDEYKEIPSQGGQSVAVTPPHLGIFVSSLYNWGNF